MKNKFLYLIFTIFALIFVSCSNLIEPPEFSDEDDTLIGDDSSLEIDDIDNLEKEVNSEFLDAFDGNGEKAIVYFSLFKTNSRTMKPTFSNDDFIKLELYAYKLLSSGSYSDPICIFNDETADCIKNLNNQGFELIEGTYKFTLLAYTKDDGYIFSGSTEKEIIPDGTNEVSFTLRASGANLTPAVTRENWGHLNAKFYISDKIKRVTAGMFYGIEEFSKFGVDVYSGEPTKVGDEYIYKGENAYYYGQIELEIKNDSKGNYVEYSDSLPEYLHLNDNKTGLPNGTYGIWVRGFLATQDEQAEMAEKYPGNFVWYDGDSWATEYRELIWIANGKTTEAERDISTVKYDGFAYFNVKGAKDGLFIPCGFVSGTKLDESLIPQEYRPDGLKFSGWRELVYENGVLVSSTPVPENKVLTSADNGKLFEAAYTLTITIPKYKGNDGLPDTALTTWDFYKSIEFYPYLLEMPDFEYFNDDEAAQLSLYSTVNEDHTSAMFIFDSSTSDFREPKHTHIAAIFPDCGDVAYQIQQGNNNTMYLNMSDEMYTKNTYKSTDNNIEFEHYRAAVKFNLNGLPTDKKFRTMVLYVPGDYIPVERENPYYNEGTVVVKPEPLSHNQKDDDHFYLTLANETEEYPDFKSGSILNPITEGFYPASDGSLTLYAVFFEKDYTGKTVICTVIDEDENYYVAYLEGKNLKAGNIYQYTATPEKIERDVIFTSSTNGKDIAVKTVNNGAYSPEDTGSYFTFANTGYSTSIDLAYWKTLCEDSKVTWTWGNSHGVNGFTVSGTNNSGKSVSVFIPAGGYKTERAPENQYDFNPPKEYGTSLNLWTNLSFTPETGTNYGYAVYGTQEDPGVLSYFDKRSYYNVRDVDYAN